MNTKNKQDQKNRRVKTRQEQGSKKQGRNPGRKFEEQEFPETRMTR
jgi:hypothetical protein